MEFNSLIFQSFRWFVSVKPPKQRELHGTHSRLDLGKPVRHQTLGAILHYLDQVGLVRKGVWTALKGDAEWILSDDTRKALEKLLELRNPAAHWEITVGDMVSEHRAHLLGIGCEGLLVRIIQAKVRGEEMRRR